MVVTLSAHWLCLLTMGGLLETRGKDVSPFPYPLPFHTEGSSSQ